MGSGPLLMPSLFFCFLPTACPVLGTLEPPIFRKLPFSFSLLQPLRVHGVAPPIFSLGGLSKIHGTLASSPSCGLSLRAWEL